MSTFNSLLSEGDLRSDGFANEVVRIVLDHPDLLPDLIEAVVAPDPTMRGHAADALEKVSRRCPHEVVAFLPDIIHSALNDDVPMVRWHLAMVLGHLSLFPEGLSEVKHTLWALLEDESAFVRSWAIASLCILAKNYPEHTDLILQKIAAITSDLSAAVAKRAQTAIRVLSNPDSPLPRGWNKSS